MQWIDHPEFERQWGPSRNRVFSEFHDVQKVFRPGGWDCIPLPYGLRLEPRYSAAILVGCEEAGDDLLALHIEEGHAPVQCGLVMNSTEWMDRHRLVGKAGHGIVDTSVLAPSGRWGLACYASLDDVALLGGDRAVISAFLRAAGGREAVRKRFQDFVEHQWAVSRDFRELFLRINASRSTD